MAEAIKALVVILVLATGVFTIAKAPACAMATAPADFNRRRNLWIGITLAAFLAHDFWIFIVLTLSLLVVTLPGERNKLALFFFVLFAVPPIPGSISGLGVISHFFSIDYIRLLALTVLLAAMLKLQSQKNNERFGRFLPDKLLVGYLVLNMLLMLSASTLTNTMRHGVFYAFIDVFLPYYVASRSLKNLQEFRDALMSLGVAALVLGAIAVFEYARHWLLYSPVVEAMGVTWGYGHYLERGEGTLRAQGSAGQPIPLGYVLAVAACFFLYLRKLAPRPQAAHLGLMLLILGLLASVSRGPWVGAVVMFLVFAATGSSAVRGYAKIGAIGALFLPLLLATSIGQSMVDALPFVGSEGESSVTYRQQLLQIAIQVILQNPLFGAFDYMYSPELQEMKQGEGIIDIVNSYISIGLSSGLVGLTLFAGFFIAIAIGIFRAMRTLPDKNDERYLLGQVLLSGLIGILVIIATVSSISFIPVMYWSVAGMGVAYARMIASGTDSPNGSRAAGPAVVSPRPWKGS